MVMGRQMRQQEDDVERHELQRVNWADVVLQGSLLDTPKPSSRLSASSSMSLDPEEIEETARAQNFLQQGGLSLSVGRRRFGRLEVHNHTLL